MMRDWLGLIGFSLLLPGLVTAVRFFGERFGLGGESRRKAVHVGMGLATLSFPWVFSSWVWVAGLGALSLLMLQGLRWWEGRRGLRSVLHDVDRESLGEILFPVAVAVVFAMSDGVAWRFMIPILILTLADAAGAMVGAAYGRQRFQVLSGFKTTEGSVLVFLAAFLSAHVPLLLMTEIGRPETLLIALALALLAMLVEAVSCRGLDNLILPVTCALLIEGFSGLEPGELALRVGIILLLLAVVLTGKRYSPLEGGALLGAVLLGYACFFLGDWRFTIPPLILFLEHVHISRRIKRVREMTRGSLYIVLGLAGSFVPWLVLAAACGDAAGRDMALRGLTTAAAIHLACQNYTTRVFVRGHRGDGRTTWRSAGKGVGMVLVPGLLLAGWSGGLAGVAAQAGLALALAPAGLFAFQWISGRPDSYSGDAVRWMRQACAALLLSLPVWGLHLAGF